MAPGVEVDHFNARQVGTRSVVVIRPPNSEEQNGNLIGAQIQLDGSWVIDLKDSAPSVPTATPSKEPRYQFAAAYGFQAHPLETLCSQEVEPLIQGFLNGESAAIVAYGETGSGKSYICGTQALKSQPWEHSIGPYVARRVWEWAAEKKVQAPTIECSMIEIYREGSGKEQIYDLLVGFERRKVKGEYHGWSEHQIASPQELLGKLTDGAQLRNTSLTDGNARSSRSHAIFTIRLRYTRKGADGKQQRVTGRLMLVDLAGAEAASSAQVGSTQQKQGSGINTGLSALQKVISEASKGGQVPYYRLSKLTHLLKPALGGEGGRNGCNLLFLGCIVPVAGAATRTRNTLEYIREAAQIKNVVQADIESLEARRDRALMQENESLKAMNAALAEEVSALRAAGTSSTEPRSSPEVVILSTEEHEALLREAQQWKDRATALEVVLKDADGRYRQVQEELKAAVQRADSAEAAAAAVQPAALTPTAALPDRSAVTDASATAGTPAAAVGGGAGISPGLAALAISPILSAAHSHSMELKSARGQRPEAVTEALLAQEPLTVGDICLDQDESNMAPDQVKVLQELVGRRLAELEHAAPGPAAGEDTAARTLAALKLRSAEVDLLRLAVRSYNECLGSVVSELELSQAREAETLAQFQRAAREKVEYVQMVAQYGAALDRSEANVLQLNYQVEEARRQSMPGVSPSTGLLGRVMGARGTPAHSPPVSPAKPARPQSEDPQRSQSPPQQRPQQRRTEGHQQQQEAESSSGPRRWTSALGGLFKGSPAATQGTQTPAMSPPSSSPPRSPGPSPGPSPRQALDDHHAGQGVRGAPETGREPSHGGALEPFPLDLADLSDGAGSEKAASVIEILSDDGDEGGGSGIIEAYMEDDLQQAPSRRQLLPNGVVPTTRQERQLQLQMQGGVDVGAISARRGQQISEQFKQQNTHWRAPGDEKKKEGASRKR